MLKKIKDFFSILGFIFLCVITGGVYYYVSKNRSNDIIDNDNNNGMVGRIDRARDTIDGNRKRTRSIANRIRESISRARESIDRFKKRNKRKRKD